MSDRTAKKADAFEGFRNELIARDEEIGSLLPTTISREAFRNTAIIAVKKNPQLLECERRSLHNAVSAAAFDGLRPDGKEGVILPRREKIKVKGDNGKETEKWILVASWQPMTYGIRKRARELDNMVIDAAVVHKNDVFDWDVGDTPYIHHKPTPLDMEPGDMVGVYAIFRRGEDILHREVMRKVDVMAVKSISKQQEGLLWTKFEGEAWRKSAIKRGAKTVPCSDRLEKIIDRFDDMHDVGNGKGKVIEGEVRKLPPPPPPPPPTGIIEHQPATIIKGGSVKEDEGDLPNLRKHLAAAKTRDELDDLQRNYAGAIMAVSSEEREEIIKVIQEAKARIEKFETEGTEEPPFDGDDR